MNSEVGVQEHPNGNEDVEATEGEKFVYEQIKSRYEFEYSRTSNLDSKSSNLVGWIGLIISILAVGSGILFDTTTTFKISVHQLGLLSSTFVLLIASLFFSLLAYRVKSYEVVPNPPTLFIKEYVGKVHKEILAAIAKAMASASENNEKQNDKKARFIKFSWGLFLTGMIVASVSVFAIMNISIK